MKIFLFLTVLGLIVGIFLGKYWFNQPIIHGPDSNIIKYNVYQEEDGKCYKYNPKPYVCGLI